MRTYQRGSVWCIDYSFNGRRVRKKVGTSKKMADLALKEVELRIAKGEFLGVAESKRVIFDRLCDEYLAFSRANKTPMSYRRDQTSVKNLKFHFGGKLMTEISVHDLETYKSLRRDEVKPATVNRELSCIKHMFNKAVQWDYLHDNPLRAVRKFKEGPGRIRCLSDEDEATLLRYCPEYTRPIVIFAVNTGMRKGEILGLKWRDINLRHRQITVRHSKNHEARTIPMNDTVHALLCGLGPQLPDQYVFCHADGRRFREIYYGFKNAVKRAGIVDFTFHDLRHTFASRLAMNGVGLRAIQTLLGHKTLAMTMRYSHLSDKSLRQAVDTLAQSVDESGVGTNLAQVARSRK